MLPGRHVISDRKGAPFVGYWMHSAHEGKSEVFHNLRVAYDAAIVGAESFGARVAELRNGGTLTEKGVQEAATKEAAAALARIARNKLEATAALKRDIPARRAKMSAIDIDRSDVIGEMQRREIRERLNAMPEKDRLRILARADDAVLEAVLSVSALAVDIPQSALDEARDRRLSSRHGAELSLLGDLSDAVDSVERAFDAARDEVRHYLGMLPSDFKAFVEPIEAPVVAEFDNRLASHRAPEKPVLDVEAMGKDILALPYADRSRLIDIALERQTEELYGREAAE